MCRRAAVTELLLHQFILTCRKWPCGDTGETQDYRSFWWHEWKIAFKSLHIVSLIRGDLDPDSPLSGAKSDPLYCCTNEANGHVCTSTTLPYKPNYSAAAAAAAGLGSSCFTIGGRSHVGVGLAGAFNTDALLRALCVQRLKRDTADRAGDTRSQDPAPWLHPATPTML